MSTGTWTVVGAVAAVLVGSGFAACSSASDDKKPLPPVHTTTSSGATTGSASGGGGASTGAAGAGGMVGEGGAGGVGGAGGGTGGSLPPTCTDQKQNGAETDVDCGGPNCNACADLKHCGDAGDCVSKVCDTGICQPPTCTDGVKNGAESDIDCGNACATKCALGGKCVLPTDCATSKCANGTCQCPAKMTIVPVTGGNGGAYCMDATEVTYEEYEVFYTANPDLSATLPAECGLVPNYTPAQSTGWPPTAGTVHNPVVGVTWCQAYAYCLYSSKHLCGSISGGPNAIGNANDASQSEWYNACSSQGVNAYPYGNSFDPNKCNDALPPSLGPVPVQNVSGMPLMTDLCIGGAPGLYDMSGNVAEWENSCDGATGAADNCLVRGGAFGGSDTDVACTSSRPVPRIPSSLSDYQTIGIRCCD